MRADLKERLENYQEECFLALWDYWTEGVARRDEVKTSWHCGNKRKPNTRNVPVIRGKLLQQCKSEKRALEHELYKLNS